MAEYVKKDDVIAILRNLWHRTYNGIPVYSEEIVKAMKDVCAIPAADVVPVRHGRWIGKNSPYDVNIHICSVCRGQVSILGNKLRFCPNCGAKMDGGESNE